MKRDLIIGIGISVFLHAGFVFGGQLLKAKPVAVVRVEETPVVELMQPVPVEPEVPETVDNADQAPADLSDLAPPMQADTPSAVQSPFVQQIQAPPPPGMARPTGAITIPTRSATAANFGSGLKNIFDLAALDQRPVVTVGALVVYPFEMKRVGIKSGEATVLFIVDTEGNVRDPYIVKSSNPGFDAEAIKAVSKMKFKPGRKGGGAVNTRVQQPVNFTLSK